jgi:hypothetical protein
MAYRRHGNGLASADALTHLESQVAVIFANRHWLEPTLGADAFGRAVVARVLPHSAARESGPELRPGRDPAATLDTLAVQAQAAYRQQDFGQAAALMKELVQSTSHARKYHIKLAHTLLLSAPWHELSSFLPAGTNDLLVSGWLNSVFRGAPVNAEGRPIPWYTYPAIEFLERTAGADQRVFEWGSGNSTLWWAERARQVVSVEHDRRWYEQIRSTMPQHVTLQHCVAAEDYVVQIAKYPRGTFSTVVIDGEARNECARLAAEYADARGIIVFDNSDRRGFSDGVAHLSAQGWKRIDFYGLIPSYLYKNCTSVFFRDDAVLQRAGLPADAASCLGPTCSQALGQ